MNFVFPTTENPSLLPSLCKRGDDLLEDILKDMRAADGVRQAIVALRQADLYAPIRGKLTLEPDGVYSAVLRDPKGKISKHLKLRKMTGSRLVSAGKNIALYLVVAEIAGKLDRIQGQLNAVHLALDDDRMQKLQAAIGGVIDALEAKRDANKEALLNATIPHLRGAVCQMIATVRREIALIPVQQSWAIARVIRDRDVETREATLKAEQTVRACLHGISVMGQAYAAIGEFELGFNSARRALQELGRTGIETAEYRARCIRPLHIDDRPESPWAELRKALPEIIKSLEEKVGDTVETLELEITLSDVDVKQILDLPAPSEER